MILLLGGTSETAVLATLLAETGYRVLVSTATDVDLNVGSHPAVARRCGKLDQGAMEHLIRTEKVRAIVDATHPYATRVQRTARAVAERTGCSYWRYLRSSAIAEDGRLYWVDNHKEAARVACSFGFPVLLTTGSRNLKPYVQAAHRAGVPLSARMLFHPDSVKACKEASLPEKDVVFGRGPFSIEDNRSLIRSRSIGVLVTKDSGRSGGVPEKLEAARLEGCRVVMIKRPSQEGKNIFRDEWALVYALKRECP